MVGVVAATAELVPALGAAEVHAATFGQSVLEPAVRTSYAVVSQEASQALPLVLRIVLPLPLLELLTGQILVLRLPRFLALSAKTPTARWAGDLQLVSIIDKPGRAVTAPQELWIFHQSVLSQLFMEQLVHIEFQTVPQLYVQRGKVAVQLFGVIDVWLTADRTHHVSNVFISHSDGEMLPEAVVAHGALTGSQRLHLAAGEDAQTAGALVNEETPDEILVVRLLHSLHNVLQGVGDIWLLK